MKKTELILLFLLIAGAATAQGRRQRMVLHQVSNKEIVNEVFAEAIKMEEINDVGVVDFLVSAKVVDSKRQAREDIQNKAIELNGEKINAPDYIVGKKDLLFSQYIIAKRGKRDYKFISL